jgi:hypothetical protein
MVERRGRGETADEFDRHAGLVLAIGALGQKNAAHAAVAELTQAFEGLMQGEQVGGIVAAVRGGAGQGDVYHTAAAFPCGPATRVIDEHVAHVQCGKREEVRAVMQSISLSAKRRKASWTRAVGFRVGAELAASRRFAMRCSSSYTTR